MNLCGKYGHTWVAGMMYVHSEDVWGVYLERLAKNQPLPECERCEHIYDPDEDE